jgi:predicted outer membrane repeat protein
MRSLNFAILALCLTALCGSQGTLSDHRQGGFLEHELEYTKEDMDVHLDYACEKANGVALRSINLVSPPSVPIPGKALQDLIDSAEDGSIRHVPSGYYGLDQTLHIDKNLTLIGEGSVIIDADNGHQILSLGDGKSNIVAHIENITFTNGRGNYGGAIRTKVQKLVIKKCILKNNAAYEGSGLYGDGGDISILNSTISNNVAIADTVSMPYGGKLLLENTNFNNNIVIEDANSLFFVGDSNQPPGESNDEWMYRYKPREVFEDYSKGIYKEDLEMVMINCTFHDNVAKGNSATISEVVAVGNVLIANSEFRSNQGEKYGGTISAGGDSVVITNTNIIDNAITIWGPSPGIKIYGGNVLIDHCVVSGNHNTEGGRADCGGIYVSENSSVEIVDSTITDNKGDVGGIYINSCANLTMAGCNISGNSASNKGGAIYNEGNLTLVGGEIKDNRASIGGSIWNANHMTITDVKIREVVEPVVA